MAKKRKPADMSPRAALALLREYFPESKYNATIDCDIASYVPLELNDYAPRLYVTFKVCVWERNQPFIIEDGDSLKEAVGKLLKGRERSNGLPLEAAGEFFTEAKENE